MLRRKSFLLVVLILIAATAVEARSKFEVRVFSGLRFGGSFIDGGYEDDVLLEQVDIAPGMQVGASFYVPIGATTLSGQGMMFELLFNFQSSDLRFKPASISNIPDSIVSRFDVDGDKLILGEVDVKYLHGGVIYKFGSNSGWNPHVNASIGATIFSATDGDLDETKFSFSMGGGVTRMFSETIGSRLQLRTFFTSLPSDDYWVDRYGGVWESVDNNMFFQGEISGGIVVAF